VARLTAQVASRLRNPSFGGCKAPSEVPIIVGVMAPSPHNFRYEFELCSLPEGATLAEWRRGYDDPLLQATKNDTTPALMSPSAHTRSRLIHRLRRKRRPTTS
jgi:hypothetical protein